jgi:hypothetical protein
MDVPRRCGSPLQPQSTSAAKSRADKDYRYFHPGFLPKSGVGGLRFIHFCLEYTAFVVMIACGRSER